MSRVLNLEGKSVVKLKMRDVLCEREDCDVNPRLGVNGTLRLVLSAELQQTAKSNQ